MKNRAKIISVIFVLIASTLLFSKQTAAQRSYVSFQVFYDQLSPYGEWVDNPNFGYVWLPDAGPDFVPYSTEGQWIMTEYGWTWFSNYEWGWAPFHYGRWDFDNYYGWFWVPDNQWGPSWVSWRRADGFYGWSPMSPGMSLDVSFGRDYDRHNNRWIFVRDQDFSRSNIYSYRIDQNNYDRIIVNSTVINNIYVDRSRNTTYVTGPNRIEVQRVTGQKVRSVRIQENSRPGQEITNGRLRIYRPEVKTTNERGQKPAPSRITKMNEVKRPAERNVTNQERRVLPATNTQTVPQPKELSPQRNQSQPTQQRTINPSENNSPIRQQKSVSPQSNRKVESQPARQQVATPVKDAQPVQQQRKVSPQRNTNVPASPAIQRTVTPAKNVSPQPQIRTSSPQKSNNSKDARESKSEENGRRR